MSVCVFVRKDLANRWTDRVLFYRVASHRFVTILGDGTITLQREIATPPPKKNNF